MKKSEPTEGVRIDKWLWAARFFKTRSIAKTAVENGKVKVDGIRVKPSRILTTGLSLEIQQGHVVKTVVVMKLDDRRGNATQAAHLFEETKESIQARELAALQRKSASMAVPRPQTKPNKKERRQLIELNNHPGKP